jgi:hypothetical protein
MSRQVPTFSRKLPLPASGKITSKMKAVGFFKTQVSLYHIPWENITEYPNFNDYQA